MTIKILVLLLSINFLVGCATSVEDIDLGTHDTKEMYDMKFGGHGFGSDVIRSPSEDDKYDPVTRNAVNEIDSLFPMSHNPRLVMYVYPHLNDYGQPIPGYSTPFRMYEDDHYKLNDNSER